MLISNPLKKLMRRKLPTTKWQKNEVFYFYYCVQKFLACNVFMWTFFSFFLMDSNHSIEFCVMLYDTHIWICLTMFFLSLHFLLTLKANNVFPLLYLHFLVTLKANADEASPNHNTSNTPKSLKYTKKHSAVLLRQHILEESAKIAQNITSLLLTNLSKFRVVVFAILL